jgi:lysophospholipase L1-like esterase
MRIAFVGDSLTVGVGDPHYLGWVGRLCAASPLAGLGLTAYNLGVRSETSTHIKNRIGRELPPRLLPRDEARVVLSFGVNDAKVENGRRKVELSQSVDNLFDIVTQVSKLSPVLMVGPPPVLDDGHRGRVEELSDVFSRTCEDMGVPYLEMCRALCRDAAYLDSLVAAGDGYHPEAAGYAAMAARVREWEAWQAWMRGC